MKKALALVLGIIFVFVTIPSISAFADSDPGLTNFIITNLFAWNTSTPYIDSSGWIYNNYFNSATLVSNGVLSHPIPQTVVSLYTSGDYFEVSFDSDIVSSWANAGLFLISIAYDSSTSPGTHYFIPDGAVNCSFCGVEAFYTFQNNLTIDSRNWRILNFIVNSEYLSTTNIRIEYDGIPCTFPITMIRIQQWRQSSFGGFTQEQITYMQSNLITAFNVARLADIIGNIEPSDVDLSTLEATTTSILQKLVSVPDIIQYIDQIETLDTNILNAIDLFTIYYKSLFENVSLSTTPINYALYDDQLNPITVNNTRLENNIFYIVIPITDSYDHAFLCFDFISSKNPINIEYALSIYPYNNLNNINDVIFNSTYYETYLRNYSTYQISTYTSLPYLNWEIQSVIFKINYDIPFNVYYTSAWQYYRTGYKNFNISWYDRIELYLKQILGSNNNSVTQSIDQVNDTVADQIDDITQFEDTYNQSLDTSASQIDVSSYQIQQTSGMSWMRTYTEYNFDHMQNFRILFLTPLVLALAAFFLRRKQ